MAAGCVKKKFEKTMTERKWRPCTQSFNPEQGYSSLDKYAKGAGSDVAHFNYCGNMMGIFC